MFAVMMVFISIMRFLPKRDHDETILGPFFYCSGMLLQSVLLDTSILFSSPAILAWITAGKI